MTKHAEDLAKLGWQYFECPACGSEGARAFPKPEQEPVAWMCADESLINKGYARFSHVCMGEWKIPVYTTPPQRSFDYKEHAEGLQRDYDLLLAEYNLLKQDLITVVDIEKIIKFKERNR